MGEKLSLFVQVGHGIFLISFCAREAENQAELSSGKLTLEKISQIFISNLKFCNSRVKKNLKH